MQKIQVKWNICFTLPTLHFNKMTQTVVDLAAWTLNLSTVGNMVIQGLLQGGRIFLIFFKEHGYTSRIKFATAIILNKESNNGEHNLRYKIMQ